MKLKKSLIEEFIIIKHNLLKRSPRYILVRLSNTNKEYFFEKYIDGNDKFRRELKKRFDNVINFNIKKIQSPEFVEGIEKKKVIY